MLGSRKDGFVKALAASRQAGASLGMLLAEGGDARIRLDPLTRQNRYGTTTTPVRDEISFASTTANTISEGGFAAAGRALARLLAPDPATCLPIGQWFDDIRVSITHLLGIPSSVAVLTASGTDAEVLTLCVTVSLERGPLTNILIAPEETGSGVSLAASGCHFSNSTALGAPVTVGGAIDGLATNEIEVAVVPIRDAKGAPLAPEAVDDEAAKAMKRELRRGRTVLLHVLDTSKTGLTGPTRKAARTLMASAPNRVRVVVDACQLRCSLTQIKRDLADGFMVQATGSKFAGGPPFCGVVLLPAALAEEIAARASLPRGIADYSAALDWPAALRDRAGQMWASQANIGLGLRWAAALDGIASMAAMGDNVRTTIAARFTKEVRDRAKNLRSIDFDHDEPDLGSGAIVPLAVRSRDDASSAFSAAQSIQTALREPSHGPVCHVGQPVCLRGLTVLRIAASAYTLAGIATRMGGSNIDQAFQPVAEDLDSLFEKWSFIERQL